MSGRATYRVRQFWRALVAPYRAHATPEAEKWLAPGELALFVRLSPAARRHGADVARTLVARGYGERTLLAAALLHDAGKPLGGKVSLIYRVLTVLLGACGPGVLPWLARQPVGRGFRTYLAHPEIGARLAEEAGSALATVVLIRRHNELPGPDADPLRWVLWQADNEN
jgi:hypothetical protein